MSGLNDFRVVRPNSRIATLQLFIILAIRCVKKHFLQHFSQFLEIATNMEKNPKMEFIQLIHNIRKVAIINSKQSVILLRV